MTRREEIAQPKVRELVWTTDHGKVCIAFPSRLSADDVEEIEAVVAIWLGGLKRQAALEAEPDQLASAGSDAAQVEGDGSREHVKIPPISGGGREL
jgi:hypothetical protein